MIQKAAKRNSFIYIFTYRILKVKKILIIYYSKNGSTEKMAEKISMGVKM
jgi:flavorubredoxin